MYRCRWLPCADACQLFVITVQLFLQRVPGNFLLSSTTRTPLSHFTNLQAVWFWHTADSAGNAKVSAILTILTVLTPGHWVIWVCHGSNPYGGLISSTLTLTSAPAPSHISFFLAHSIWPSVSDWSGGYNLGKPSAMLRTWPCAVSLVDEAGGSFVPLAMSTSGQPYAMADQYLLRRPLQTLTRGCSELALTRQIQDVQPLHIH